VGTSLTIQPDGTGLTTVVVTSRTASLGDITIYTQPFRPVENYNLVNAPYLVLTNPPFDTAITETPVTSTWSSISAVRVKTQYLPINPEFAPAIVGAGNGVIAPPLPTVQMVTDFVINGTNTLVTFDQVQYVSEQPRWIDMVGTLPVNIVDLTCVWVDMQGKEHLIYIPQGYRFDMKLAFKRKYTKCLPGF